MNKPDYRNHGVKVVGDRLMLGQLQQTDVGFLNHVFCKLDVSESLRDCGNSAAGILAEEIVEWRVRQ
ncbi:MAG: hypothetical protein ACXVAM_16145 [Vulcanimicrobiaceae bacterium]